nr:PREDICTED: transcription factor IIIA-like [Linepithema humile]
MGQTGDQSSNDNVLNIQNDIDIRSKKKHKCTYPECHAMFAKPSKLERHIRLHTGERPYKCNHEGCTKSYTNSSHLKRHLETHNPTKRVFVCPHCSMSISNLHNLKRHCKLMHSEDKKLVCKECGETFNKKHQFAQHKTIHFGPVIYTCDKCNHSFTNISKFKKDQKRHEKAARDYVCTEPGCLEVFDKWIQLCVHRKTKHVTIYICDTCNKSFFSKNKLRNHVKIHFKNRSVLSCSYDNCNKTYFSKYNLETHVKIKHCGERFYCDICSMGLTSKRKLIEHIQRHYELKKKKKKKIQRKKRKDAGLPKRSAITKLIGVDLPPSLEKMILERESTIAKTETFDKNLNNTEIL